MSLAFYSPIFNMQEVGGGSIQTFQKLLKFG